MELGHGNRPFASRTADEDGGVESDEGDGHVGGVRGNARARGAKDRVHAVEALQRVTARTRLALVAAGLAVVEVLTARTLHQVTARRRHVADLAGSAHHDRLRQEGIVDANEPTRRQMAVAHEGADADAAVRPLLDLREGQASHVDQVCRLLDLLAHQVDEIRAPAEELSGPVAGDQANRCLDVAGARVREGFHRVS